MCWRAPVHNERSTWEPSQVEPWDNRFDIGVSSQCSPSKLSTCDCPMTSTTSVSQETHPESCKVHMLNPLSVDSQPCHAAVLQLVGAAACMHACTVRTVAQRSVAARERQSLLAKEGVALLPKEGIGELSDEQHGLAHSHHAWECLSAKPSYPSVALKGA